MTVNFSGRWTARPKGFAFLPGLASGMVSITIDHIEPLLQKTVVVSAPSYTLSHFACNYRTDGTEVVSSSSGIEFRTVARWVAQKLDVQTFIKGGSLNVSFHSTWRLSKDGRILTIFQRTESLGGQVMSLYKSDL